MTYHAGKKNVRQNSSKWTQFDELWRTPFLCRIVPYSWRSRDGSVVKKHGLGTEPVPNWWHAEQQKKFVKVRQNEFILTNFDELWRINDRRQRIHDRCVINPTKFVMFRTHDESLHFDVMSCRIHLICHHLSKWTLFAKLWRTIVSSCWRIMTNYFKKCNELIS